MLAALGRHPLIVFFALAYLFSWSYWVPVAVAGGGLSHFPGLLGPMVAAFVTWAIVDGRRGLRDLLARMFRWRVSLRWYAAAVTPAVTGLVGLGMVALFGHGFPPLHDLSSVPGLPALGWWAVAALMLVINGYGEETGWRGFAWSRLRERHSLGGAAIALTVPWAIWHVPLFWIDSGMRGMEPWVIPGWLFGLAAGAVVLGWLYERARFSILIPALFHSFLNMASSTAATGGLVAGLVSALIIVWAIIILRRHSGGNSMTDDNRR